MKSAVEARQLKPCDRCTFSIAVDATKCAQVKELSTAHCAIYGG